MEIFQERHTEKIPGKIGLTHSNFRDVGCYPEVVKSTKFKESVSTNLASTSINSSLSDETATTSSVRYHTYCKVPKFSPVRVAEDVVHPSLHRMCNTKQGIDHVAFLTTSNWFQVLSDDLMVQEALDQHISDNILKTMSLILPRLLQLGLNY